MADNNKQVAPQPMVIVPTPTSPPMHEKRIDETEPGGRYIVNGLPVNSEGKPIEEKLPGEPLNEESTSTKEELPSG